ncbi:MSF1-domain-containing protein [Eremomyces bilateralis CBS 781.70]|uniref:MSF1-domain-containing protein n=1 Tax=Eremomyces bilateralis CBS 781.70 TaxID=1392243 RepID=A0A6G1FW75_9PEZI|nr:MSF1-domain-containing protein [Eremomyces bilateralis CBS 781.70]KAF1809931.1 MSF1-domain-containing protein [Eremomyces bilateralis CBS 781.70]
MKVFSSETQFDYSWEEVSCANWLKYSPWNKMTPHVIAVDTLQRSVDPATGILRTERLITCQQSPPKWILPFLKGQSTSHVYETSYIDPKTRKLTMCAMNITWSDFLNVRETCSYEPVRTNTGAEHTQFKQYAEITALCGGWQKIKNSIESVSVEQFRQNAANGRQGFEMVLEMCRKVWQEEREKAAQQQTMAA